MLQLVTGWIQSFYYSLAIRAGSPKPQPGSARFASDRRRIQLAVVGLYLLYTIFEADYEATRRPTSFYDDLGLSTDPTEQKMKSNFRRLAARYHPDKVSQTGGSEEHGRDAADYFIHLKLAYDTLTEPTKRFAYDRFGPGMLAWASATTIRDYVVRGVLHGILPHYGMAAVVLYITSWLGYLSFAQYYRWLAMAGLCVCELILVTRPEAPSVLRTVNSVVELLPAHGPYLQFQAIDLMRRLAVTLYVGLAQLGPLLQAEFGQKGAGLADADDGMALANALAKLDETAKSVDAEASRLWAMELAPYSGDSAAISMLERSSAQWLVTNTIRADPTVKDALAASFRRRTGEVETAS